jgi:hypothetical protein
MVPDGHYAVRYSTQCRLLKLKTITGQLGKKDDALLGKRVLFYKSENRWQRFAFLNDDNSVQFYHKYAVTCTPEQLESMRSMVAAIVKRPQHAQDLYIEIEQKSNKS